MRDDGDFERLFLWILCACLFIFMPKLHMDLIVFEKVRVSIERNEEFSLIFFVKLHMHLEANVCSPLELLLNINDLKQI
jgi:hypothetical protein